MYLCAITHIYFCAYLSPYYINMLSFLIFILIQKAICQFCREIWRCFCIYSLSYICHIILCSVWSHRYDFNLSQQNPKSDLICIIVLPFPSAGAVGLSFLQFTNMNYMRNLSQLDYLSSLEYLSLSFSMSLQLFVTDLFAVMPAG